MSGYPFKAENSKGGALDFGKRDLAKESGKGDVVFSSCTEFKDIKGFPGLLTHKRFLDGSC